MAFAPPLAPADRRTDGAGLDSGVLGDLVGGRPGWPDPLGDGPHLGGALNPAGSALQVRVGVGPVMDCDGPLADPAVALVGAGGDGGDGALERPVDRP